MNRTIVYYNTNAKAFCERTLNADLMDSYQRFLKYLPKKAHILDAGCGGGRDAKYFSEHGYPVTAFDASEEMVKIAAQFTKLSVLLKTFSEIDFQEKFDAVWAQASLLHVPYHETKKIYQKIYDTLKPNGIFFASYKYGQDHMAAEERDFWNMDEITIRPYFSDLFEVLEIWNEVDTRSQTTPSKDRKWLNFIVKKSIGSDPRVTKTS